MTEQGGRAARFVTLLVSNAIKLAGLVIGVHAAFQPSASPAVLGFAALCIAGGQFSEATILGIVERIFGDARKLDKQIEREQKRGNGK